jgi:MFS family permease
LFSLSRLGFFGTTNALFFIVIGLTLVVVQVRFIGMWSRKYGEHRLVQGALALLAIGLVLMALTPKQPHLFYVKRIVEYDLREQVVSSTEAILGDLNVTLPEEQHRGIFGVLWVMVMVIPLSVGAGLIRPGLNSLMTRQVSKGEYGSILGVSSSFVSAANAAAPLLGGILFQRYGSTIPFLLGGVLMGILALLSVVLVKERSPTL